MWLPNAGRIALFVAVLFLTASSGLAQDSRGAVHGVVRDGSGARVASAMVQVQAEGTTIRRDVETSAQGAFQLDDLTPGVYGLQVEKAGFAIAHAQVQVEVSTTREISVVLRPGLVRESVDVEGQASSVTTQPIDTSSAVHRAVITRTDLDNVPLAHRSFANIAYLAPGTEPVEPSDPTKARITAVSFGGSSGLNVDLSVDGGDNSDDYIGGFLQNFSPDAIQEFAVRTSQEDADTGRTVGGSVVITTRHGTNQWHGSGAFYERADALTARYPIDNPAPDPKQPFSRQNYIATLGGPVKKDKFWLFSSFEYVHENASIAYSPNSISEFNALASLASAGLIPGVSSIAVPNNVRIPFRDALGTVRLDWAQSAKSQWFVRGAIDNYTTNNDLIQQATLPSTGATSGSNYLNLVLSNVHTFNPNWIGAFTFDASGLHHTEARNGHLGFALAFPFSATFQTISGFETFGDNQFATPITAFPVLRNQEKYQFRYDVTHASGRHTTKFGINFIHEPVLSGALSGAAETLIQYPNDPSFYAQNPSQFYFDTSCSSPTPDPNITCTATAAGNGSFSQNIQRLGLYLQDGWRVTPRLTLNLGLRYDTTFGLFTASGRSQLDNPAFLTLKALDIPLISSAPNDYRAEFGPRLGVAYSLGDSGNTVVRAGIGMYYNDLAQNGWVPAFQAVNAPAGVCTDPTNASVDNSGCIPGSALGGGGGIVDPHYKTPYAIHGSVGIQHALNRNWMMGADWVHENGVHAYRAYSYTGGVNLFTPKLAAGDPNQANVVPNVDVFRSDNRSSYDGLLVHLQGNVSSRFNLVANYTLATAKTWGCTVGELFDYVNGVCDPLNAFGPGDYGPSGEDVRHRFVLAGTFHAPGGLEISTLTQVESARPFTLGNGGDRAVINGVKTTLDQFRGTPFVQIDLRLARPIQIQDRWTIMPFVEFFNLLNRNNPANNFVADVGALPVPASQIAAGNVTDLCGDASCSTLQPITSLNQLRVPAGGLGDFFGPGTTVGVPFAAQIGIRVNF